MKKKGYVLSDSDIAELRKIVFGLMLQNGKLKITKTKKSIQEQNNQLELGDLVSINRKKIPAFVIDNLHHIDFAKISQNSTELKNDNYGIFAGFENHTSEVPMARILFEKEYYLVSLFDIKKK